MSQFSLSISQWRVMRRAARKKRSTFKELRNWSRITKEVEDIEWLVKNGLLEEVETGMYSVTDKGKASVDMGYYEWQPPVNPVPAKLGKILTESILRTYAKKK